ncbi:glycoside hydrolase family 97 C-terminal domain-containing protein, partial [Massilia sp. Root1485]
GDIGQYIVTARRKGNTWYIGAMTNESARTVDLPLDFLAPGANYSAAILEDGMDRNHLAARNARVTGKSRLKLKLAGSGGAVVTLTQASQ